MKTWQRFFDAHAPEYMGNVFTKNTVSEMNFLTEELGLVRGMSVLDVGCGTGRHSIELAKRGCSVTGLDLSTGMLAQAKAAAQNAGVHVEWVHADATQFSFQARFDAAICLCEGAFGLLGQDDDPIAQPLAILCNVSRSLKPRAKTLFTVLNGAAMLRKNQNSDVAEGRFDPMLMVESTDYAPREDLPPIPVRERAFVPTELRLLFRLAGMTVLNMWGGTAGNWGRRPLDLDEIEIMVVARKTDEPCELTATLCPPAAHAKKPTARHTVKQGQYLAFIQQYTTLHGVAPSEAEMQQFFRVLPPTVHQMVLTLERKGLIERTPGEARSIKVLVPADELPRLM